MDLGIRIDGPETITRSMDTLMNFGRGYQCYMESAITPGKARLPRRLKKATQKYLRLINKTAMIIMPQAQFVCLNKKGQLIVCHAKY